MKKSSRTLLSLIAFSLVAGPAIHADRDDAQKPHAHQSMKKSGNVGQLLAVMTPTERSSVSGTVQFKDAGSGKVEVTAQLSGLDPNALHAIHIHEYGDIRAEDGTAAGSHYNPEDHPHGLPTQKERHAGDFGNLEADENGEADFSITVDNLTLNGKKNPIIGRAVIIHASEDDGSQPTGDAGRRLAQGVIGVMNTGWEAEED